MNALRMLCLLMMPLGFVYCMQGEISDSVGTQACNSELTDDNAACCMHRAACEQGSNLQFSYKTFPLYSISMVLNPAKHSILVIAVFKMHVELESRVHLTR